MENSPIELPRPLSAKYTSDFAYTTIKDRLPVILTKVIDQVVRDKTMIFEMYGEESIEDVKKIAGQLSMFKSEIQTDKPFTLLCDEFEDVQDWNDILQVEIEVNSGSWFSSPWLLAECYFYRRIMSEFFSSNYLKTYDPFKSQKHEAIENELQTFTKLATFLNNAEDYFTLMSKFLYNSLWSNIFDQSFSENHPSKDIFNKIDSLSKFILQDDKKTVINFFHKKSFVNSMRIVDYILDNCGMELLNDLMLADIMIRTNFDLIRFHVKLMPWFVSDVTVKDFEYTLNTLEKSPQEDIIKLVKIWRGYLSNSKWIIVVDKYWTLPHDFASLPTNAPHLFNQLSEASLVVLKGDLNYRKLVQDRSWPPTTVLKNAIGNFKPTNMLILRTLKSDVVCGLHPFKIPNTDSWMISGQYAVLQFLPRYSQPELSPP